MIHRFLALTVLALLLPAAASAQKACDLKTVEKGFVCDGCGILGAKDVVNKITYFCCTSCGHTQPKEGKCPECEDQTLVKKESGANACGSCYAATRPVDVCVKDVWVCHSCDTRSAKAGKCPDCEGDLKAAKSRALIVHRCEGCGTSQPTAGKCGDEDCSHHGKPLTKTCSESGTAPHGSEK